MWGIDSHGYVDNHLNCRLLDLLILQTARQHPASSPEAPTPGPEAPPLRHRLDPDVVSILRDFVAAQRAPGTRAKYEEYLRDFLRAVNVRSVAELVAVEPARIVDYRNQLQDRSLSPSTINGRLAAVRGMFGRLLKERRIAGNPADSELVPGLQVSDVSRTEGLTVDEVNAILSTCNGTLAGLRDRALLMTLFYEGLRRSEASKLRYRDVSTKRGLLEIRDAKNNPYATIRLRLLLHLLQAIHGRGLVLVRFLASGSSPAAIFGRRG